MPSLRAPLVIAGIWIGLARVIVGAHYPSDVIAGLALGSWFALAVATQFAATAFSSPSTQSAGQRPDIPAPLQSRKQPERWQSIRHEKARH